MDGLTNGSTDTIARVTAERQDLAELLERRALTEDAARAEAVAKRHAAGGRTARENVADLVDPGSFVEYGRFAIAAQRSAPRRCEELIERTPADGLIAGTARINGELGEPARARSSPTTTLCSPARRERSATARRTGCSS